MKVNVSGTWSRCVYRQMPAAATQPLSVYLSPPSSCKYNAELPLAHQLQHLSYDPRWEFPKNRLKLGQFRLLLSRSLVT